MRLNRAWCVLPVGAVLALAGCGGEKTDVSGATEDRNKELSGQGLSLDCPKEVDGGEGTQFDCTMKGEGGKSKTVKLKIVKENDELAVDVADKAEYDSTVKELGGR
jgi:hypothetical protein